MTAPDVGPVELVYLNLSLELTDWRGCFMGMQMEGRKSKTSRDRAIPLTVYSCIYNSWDLSRTIAFGHIFRMEITYFHSVSAL